MDIKNRLDSMTVEGTTSTGGDTFDSAQVGLHGLILNSAPFKYITCNFILFNLSFTYTIYNYYYDGIKNPNFERKGICKIQKPVTMMKFRKKLEIFK